jgi:cytochrome c556
MNKIFGLVSVAAVIVVAACNREEQASAPSANNQSASNQSAANAASGSGNSGAPVDVAALMHDRHENYEKMGRAMKGISTQLKSDAPVVADIQRHSAVIAGYAPQIPSWFPAGSGPEAGRTRAKAEIWADPETFRAAHARMLQATQQFDAAAKSGDLAAIRAALPALGSSCSNCHDKFRGPELDHD